MNAKQEYVVLASLCLAVILLCLAGLVWAAVSGQFLTLDGILLALICLSMAGIFTLMLLWLAHDAGWLAFLHRRRGTPPADSPKTESK